MAKQTTIKVIPFIIEHLDEMEIRQYEKDHLLSNPEYKMLVQSMAAVSPSVTFILDGRILCSMGFSLIWTGMASGWIIPSVYVSENPLVFGRSVRQYVKQIAATFKLHRIQTNIPDDPLHKRWMAFLGFKYEGTMKMYTFDKQDSCIYARTF